MSMPPEIFRALVQEHQSMVFSIALRVTGNYEAAEEVAQDVFLELHRAAERLENEDHTRFWLRRVSVHRATDWLRRASRQPETAAEEWVEEQHSLHPQLNQNTTVVARLEDMLRTLPEAMRVAIVLRYQEDMPPTEIAVLLRQPLATVKSNLQRGLHMIRRKAEVTMKEYVR